MIPIRRLFDKRLKSFNPFFVYYSTRKTNPFVRTLDILKQDYPHVFKGNKRVSMNHADIVIIGNGVIGASVAYWLKTRAGKGLSVAVIEKDSTYQNAKKKMSVGLVHQHFSVPENVLLSQFSSYFLRNIQKNLGGNIDINYCPNGFLVLASEKYAEKLEQNVILQREYEVRNELLTPNQIKSRFPWINIDDVKLGSIGCENEGFFSSWALHDGLIRSSKQLGAEFIDAEVKGFTLEHQRDVLMEGIEPGSYKKLRTVKYTLANGVEDEIEFAACILAAGGDSGEIASLANIGKGHGILGIPLPIEHIKQNVYSLEKNKTSIGYKSPTLLDSSGFWLRNNHLSGQVLCGNMPLPSVDVDDPEYYTNIIEPPLKSRIPSLADSKVTCLGSELIDKNTYDDTGIIGPHSYYNNLYIAAGFGALSYQHAPGIGRAIAELILDGRYTTIDFSRFCFDRTFTSQPIVESNVY